MVLHPNILRKNGRNEFVVLLYEEFVALQELLEDAKDLLALRRAKLEDDSSAPSVPFSELCRRFGVEQAA